MDDGFMMMMDSPPMPPHQRRRKIDKATREETMDITVLPVTWESVTVDQILQLQRLEEDVVKRRKRPE